MLVALLGLNILILVPVISRMGHGQMDPVFGPDTAARRILTCVYIGIAVTSAVLIGMHLLKLPWAEPMTLALFGVQIAYKFCTVVAVGMRNPVVASNCGVAVVQCAAIAVWAALPG